MRLFSSYIIGFFFLIPFCNAQQKEELEDLLASYTEGLEQLEIPAFTYDYRTYFQRIPDLDKLENQKLFFSAFNSDLSTFSRKKLSVNDKIALDHLQYECAFQLERVQLEMAWVTKGREIVSGGLYGFYQKEKWYNHFIKKITTLQISPEEIMAFGMQEVSRINGEIDQIRKKNGFASLEDMYVFLNHDSFYLTDKKLIQEAFGRVDSIARSNMKSYVGDLNIPDVHPMEWPGAGSHTPPGIYLNRSQNAFGKDVFHYNYYGERYNKRMIDWLYMHEAIPGHHLQSSIRAVNQPDVLQEQSIYPGNFEGWACYVEYQGRALGLMKDDFSYLGWLEWDLVRSARLVLEAGIHHAGWSKELAHKFWQDHIYGQDEIADREITRVSNWPGQALSYKLGARFISELFAKEKKHSPAISQADMHYTFLQMGMRPLSVIDAHFGVLLDNIKKKG
jgi:uncharacterized protein (DUF885 family)